jgi:integrase
MARRGVNGEGTIYSRKDGRWEGAVYLLTVAGTRKRLRVYGATRAEVHTKLTEIKAKGHAGVPMPSHQVRLADYLDYWLEAIVKPTLRPTTFLRYSVNVRLYIKPGLGRYQLVQLTVPMVQAFLNAHLTSGHSIRSAQIVRTALSAALTNAQREELVMRNVARLVKLPSYQPADVVPWTDDEVRDFLWAARSDLLFVAFLLLALYGLRRGEVLGLRWQDVDFKQGVMRIRQQVLRFGGMLHVGPLKTRASRRDLPLLPAMQAVLRFQQRTQRAALPSESPAVANDLVFTTSTGLPIDPENIGRSFKRICKSHGIRRIKLHHLRHTAATILKNLGIPARDAQLILGHSNISTTQQIYQHDNPETRREALRRVEALLTPADAENKDSQAGEPESLWSSVVDGYGCRQISRQGTNFVDTVTSFLSGSSDRFRTCDLRLMSSTAVSLNDRLASVSLVVQQRRRQWMLGCVAVNLAVKMMEPLFKPTVTDGGTHDS